MLNCFLSFLRYRKFVGAIQRFFVGNRFVAFRISFAVMRLSLMSRNRIGVLPGFLWMIFVRSLSFEAFVREWIVLYLKNLRNQARRNFGQGNPW